jgi:hypothetical protein
MKQILRLVVYYLILFFSFCKCVSAQDSAYISTWCFDELKKRCYPEKNNTETIVRVKIKNKLIRSDLKFLRKVEQYLNSSDTAWAFHIEKASLTYRNRKKNTDSVVVKNKYHLNYFNVYIYTFLKSDIVLKKVAIIGEARTFYCNYDFYKKPHDYSLIDPVFFEHYLKGNIRVNYFYYCSEIYLGSSGVPWATW